MKRKYRMRRWLANRDIGEELEWTDPDTQETHLIRVLLDWQDAEPDVGINFEGYVVTSLHCDTLLNRQLEENYDKIKDIAEEIYNESV